jgi:threonine/homoserine/homoserine lactone efflux protein
MEYRGQGRDVFVIGVPSMVLFCCAAAMVFAGGRRYRSGERRRAMFDFFMAVCMAVFGMGFL